MAPPLRVLAAACACLIMASAAKAQPAPYSAHSMANTCCTPYAQKERMFAEARAMGAGYIRLDVVLDPIFDLWVAPAPEPRWQGVDEVVRLSRRYRLPVLAVMRATPAHISACKERWPVGHHRCAASDPRMFGQYVARVIERAPDVFRAIEVWNEPDGAWTFDGAPEEYAQMLSATHDAVKRRFPSVQVLTGGAMSLAGQDWFERVFAAPGVGAAGKFDVANVHIRGPMATLVSTVRSWREFFRRHGHTGALWVTEAGYPADDRFQDDERYRGGEPAQARYLRDALPTLLRAGADQVFVTMRDTWPSEFGSESPFSSEGVVAMDQHEPYAVRRKRAFAVIRRLVGLNGRVPHTEAKERRFRRQLVRRRQEYLDAVSSRSSTSSRVTHRIARRIDFYRRLLSASLAQERSWPAKARDLRRAANRLRLEGRSEQAARAYRSARFWADLTRAAAP
jgi:hypothetical protein